MLSILLILLGIWTAENGDSVPLPAMALTWIGHQQADASASGVVQLLLHARVPEFDGYPVPLVHGCCLFEWVDDQYMFSSGLDT
jgi:hypothetical protein